MTIDGLQNFDTRYPTDEELTRIRTWDYRDPHGLMSFVASIWFLGYWSRKSQHAYHISTGGWSGNEDIIQALQQNHMFWTLCWAQSTRGGHYIFIMPDTK